MLEINGSDIYLTKGDTAHLAVGITNAASGDAYEMQPDDTLILTVRKQAYEASPVLLQKTVKGSSDIHLTPEDTAQMATGTYKYDVELRTGADIYTVIQCSMFKLLEEVTTP